MKSTHWCELVVDCDESDGEKLGRWLSRRKECEFERELISTGQRYTVRAQVWFLRRMMKFVERELIGGDA